MKRLVILTGRGNLPHTFKELATKRGYKTFTVGVKGITDRKTDFSIPFLGFVEFEQLLKKLEKPYIVMLGKFEQNLPLLIAESLFYKLKVKLFGGTYKRNYEIFLHLKRKAETGQPAALIKAFIDYYESLGFRFLSSEKVKEILTPLFADNGNMTPTVKFEVNHQIKRFFQYTASIADMDIGQSILVKDNTVVAVEGIEGTDKTIKRACKLAGKGLILLKAARKNQDYRIDIPAVGLDTLKILKKCRVRAVILESGKVLIVDKGKFLKEAERNGIAVIGLTLH